MSRFKKRTQDVPGWRTLNMAATDLAILRQVNILVTVMDLMGTSGYVERFRALANKIPLLVPLVDTLEDYDPTADDDNYA